MSNQFNTSADWKARGYYMRVPPVVLAAYDPAGDGEDRDALVLIAREEHQKGETWDPDFSISIIFRVLMVHQMSPDLEFPDKLAMILRLHKQLRRWQNTGRSSKHVFCVESNGVGYAMASSLRENIGNYVINYTTVSNTRDVPFVEKKLAMPRLASLDNLRVLAETHCFKVAKEAPGAKILESEMASFVWRRPGRPEAMQGQRDDVVMACAGACWIGTKVLPLVLRRTKVRPTGVVH